MIGLWHETRLTMYRVQRDGDNVTITEVPNGDDFQSNLTGDAPASHGQIVYGAKKTDLIIIGGVAHEVGTVTDKLLVEELHRKGKLK
jgi:hypothetical protein